MSSSVPLLTWSVLYRVLKSVVCDVGGRECVVVMCGGVVCVCAVDESGLTITAMATLQLSAKVIIFWLVNLSIVPCEGCLLQITHGAMMTVCGERLLVGGQCIRRYMQCD